MGYKKYSPFLKSIKVLILLSFMYFTTKLDAVNLRIPVTMKDFDYHKLPVYCKASTKHFECKDENGEVYCLPDSLKCRIKCANDAELLCDHTAVDCKIGDFRCNAGDSNGTQPVCIAEHSLCDGRAHCPLADDENPSLCRSRACGAGQFACSSPGHCLPAAKRCDGHFDCARPGLDDKSDEENCVQRRGKAGEACEPGRFRCASDGKCLSEVFKCDGWNDCDDGSDERNCPVECGSDQVKCDGRCIGGKAICDGKPDCSDGADELNCQYKQCRFVSERYCSRANRCAAAIHNCDGSDDCYGGAEDEICPVSHRICREDSHWTCKSGSHCVLKESLCDGVSHCPDGSDEHNCPTKSPTSSSVSSSSCPDGWRLCNGTTRCVNVADFCADNATCPLPDAQLDADCRLLRSTAVPPCDVANGGCSQLCTNDVVAGVGLRARCSCRPGWRVDERDPKSCADADECQLFGSCSQLCANSVGSFACSCRQGYSRHGAACRAPGAAKILYAGAGGVQFVDTDTRRRSVVTDGLQLPKYVAYDVASQRVFFHTRDGMVGGVGLDGGDMRILASGVVLDAVAYDWARGLLFYSVPRLNGSNGHVGVLNVTSGARTPLLALDCPRGLAVDPRRGHLYVSLWCGRQPGIYRMSLDGTELQLLAVATGMPGHLTLDLAASPQRIYWVDSGHRAILSATLDGKDPRAHWRTQHRPNVLFDVAVFEDRLYWNDVDKRGVFSVNKFTGDDLRPVVGAGAAVSVTVYHSLLQPPVPLRPCRCDQICVAASVGAAASPAAGTCLCDRRYSLERATGACVNRTDEPTPLPTAVRTPTTTPPLKSRRLPADNVAYVAGVVIGAVCLCALVGVGVACLCLRRQDKQSVNFNHQNNFAKTVARMPKVNSRTPLTDCEIDMDQSKF